MPPTPGRILPKVCHLKSTKISTMAKNKFLTGQSIIFIIYSDYPLIRITKRQCQNIGYYLQKFSLSACINLDQPFNSCAIAIPYYTI